MKVYQTNNLGVFLRETDADPDPIEAGNWLIPAGCVLEPPPPITEGYQAVHSNGVWSLDLIPIPESPPEYNPPDHAAVVSPVISRMQGILALGPIRWGRVMEYRDTPYDPETGEGCNWATGVVIDSAGDWERHSQNIAFFQYLIDLTDEEVDSLFMTAAAIKV